MIRSETNVWMKCHRRTKWKNSRNWKKVIFSTYIFAYDKSLNVSGHHKNMLIFSVCAPPPPKYVMQPPIQSTCHNIVNKSPCKNMARASGGGGGVQITCKLGGGGVTNGNDPKFRRAYCVHREF